VSRWAWKGPGDRVTDVDTGIQSRLVKEIGDAFPSDGMLAEEKPHARTADREFVWVVDPLDGTNNFALGAPFHPWNLLFRTETDFSVLDRSRGEWGEPADDVAALAVNYLFFGLRRSTARGDMVAEPLYALPGVRGYLPARLWGQ